MIAIIFEVWPASGRVDEYLGIAKMLRDDLEKVDGFISIERFQSITEPAKYLSISFFRDEDAVWQWRNLASDRKAQAAGRGGVFKDYRLRVASIIRDYGISERTEAPEDGVKIHS